MKIRDLQVEFPIEYWISKFYIGCSGNFCKNVISSKCLNFKRSSGKDISEKEGVNRNDHLNA